jgi:hypothetical protein
MNTPKELANKRIASIIRVSTDTQDIEKQRRMVRRWKERIDVEVDGEYALEGVRRLSKKVIARTNEIIEDAAGKYDYLVVPYLDRLGLNITELCEFRKKGLNADVLIWIIEDKTGNDGGCISYDTEETIRMMCDSTVDNLAFLYKAGSIQTETKVTAAERGDFSGGIVPFGCDVDTWATENDAGENMTWLKWKMVHYGPRNRVQILYNEEGDEIGRNKYTGRSTPKKDDGDRKRYAWTIVEERRQALKDIFHWRWKERISTNEIAARLTKCGIPAFKGDCWNKQTVIGILKNPIVIGKPALFKHTASRYAERDVEGRIRPKSQDQSRSNPKRITLDREFWVQPLDGPVLPPLVSEECFYDVQKKFQKQPKRFRPSRKAEAWLRNFLVCGCCNQPMSFYDRPINHTKDKRDGVEIRKVMIYRCSTYQYKGGPGNPYGCLPFFVTAKDIEAIVDYWLDVHSDEKIELPIELIDCKLDFPPMEFDEPDPKLIEKKQDEIKQLDEEDRKIVETGLGLALSKNDPAYKPLAQSLNDNKLAREKIENFLEDLARRPTKESRLRDIKIAKESDSRAKAEALSKIIERIECSFDVDNRKYQTKYHLSKVKIVPVGSSDFGKPFLSFSYINDDGVQVQDTPDGAFSKKARKLLAKKTNLTMEQITKANTMPSFAQEDNLNKRDLAKELNCTVRELMDAMNSTAISSESTVKEVDAFVDRMEKPQDMMKTLRTIIRKNRDRVK